VSARQDFGKPAANLAADGFRMVSLQVIERQWIEIASLEAVRRQPSARVSGEARTAGRSDDAQALPPATRPICGEDREDTHTVSQRRTFRYEK